MPLAVLLRVGLFPFAENKHGDAPMRALIAERLVLEPASAAHAAHLLPVRSAAHHADAAVHRARPRRAAVVALPVAAGGLAAFFPFLALRGGWPARRTPSWRRSRWRSRRCTCRRRRRRRARRSTSCSGSRRSSGCSRRWRRAGSALSPSRACFASLAAVTRYDAWLALPMVAVAAWWLARRSDPASATRGPRCLRAGGGVLPVGLAGLGRGSRQRSALLRPLHLERPRRARGDGGRALRRARWGGRGSSASGRWRSSRR